jgi:thymidine kinase
VITSALNGTYLKEKFNSILDLVPKAEKITHIHAVCKLCGHTAPFTLRTVKCDKTEHIGGEEDYMPVCRECFNTKMAE